MRVGYLLLIWILTSGISRGQVPFEGKLLNCRKLDQNSGLVDTRNPYITQDSRGFVWIGSPGGLVRYDGISSKVYRAPLLNEQSDPHVSSKVFEDKSGAIWFTTYSGIHRIDPKTDTISTQYLPDTKQDQAAADHYAFHLDQQSRLWVVAGGKLHLLDIQTGELSTRHPLHSYACDPIITARGEVKGIANPLIGNGGGLEIISYQGHEIRRDTFFSKQAKPPLPHALILFLHVEGDSILWLPSDIGLIRFPLAQPLASEIHAYAGTKGRVHFWDAAPLGESHLWLGSSTEGLFVFNKQTKEFVRNDTSILVEGEPFDLSTINNIQVDADGNIWLSSWEKGIFYTHPTRMKFLHLPTPAFDKITPLAIADLIPTDEQHLLCVVPEQGIFELALLSGEIRSPQAFSSFHQSLGINERAKFAFQDQEGDVWIGSSSQLFLWEAASQKLKKLHWPHKRLTQMLELSSGRLLLVSFNQVWEVNKAQLLFDEGYEPKLLQSHSWYRTFVDQQDRLFASDGYDKLFVFQVRDDQLDTLAQIEGVGYLTGLAETEETLWFSGSKGLVKVDANELTLITESFPDAIGDQSFHFILSDEKGRLWLSTTNEIIAFYPSTNQIQSYNQSDGLIKGTFLRASGTKLSDGRLAFGMDNGMTLFHPADIHPNPNEPRIQITSISLNYNLTLDSLNPVVLDQLTLRHDLNTLSFEFTALEYAAPMENQFMYHLTGHDQDTARGEKARIAVYTELSPGDYTLQIWAANSDLIWSSSPKEFHITIRPPWYQTWWFLTLCFLAALFLLYQIYRFRIGQIRRKAEFIQQQETIKRKEAESQRQQETIKRIEAEKKQEQEAFKRIEAEKQQEVEAFKREAAEIETKILRLQMNPHFIFNSLNSIRAYILEENVKVAQHFLVRFSKLIRNILDLSEKVSISLAEEKELLEQYMDVEALRFGHSFSYQFEIPKELDLYEVSIPPMLLQPFVENAIIHGFRDRKQPGLITLSFWEEGEDLHCSIRDNGGGRVPGKRKTSNKPHAIDITQRRLRILEDQTGRKASLKIVDHMDPTGTEVQLIIPIE